MKILFLAPHLSTGGMPQFLLKRLQGLRNHTNNEYYVQFATGVPAFGGTGDPIYVTVFYGYGN